MLDLAGRRITFVIPSLDLGGAERQALLLAENLSREHGARVEVWGAGKAGRVAELCEEYGIIWRSVQFGLPRTKRGIIASVLKFAGKLRNSRTDIAMAYCYHANLACGLAWRLAGIRAYIWHQRDEGRHITGRRLEKLAVRQARFLVSNSKHGADFLINKLGATPEKIKVIHNGIELPDPESDRTTWRQRINVSDNCFLSCMVANLSNSKDHATLLQAWRRVIDALQKKEQEAVLILAGAFVNTHESLKSLAFDLELEKNVIFLGAVKDISGLLGASDLAVFSSKLEGVPNGVLESMAAGLAVVGTDIPGLREALPAASYGYLTPVGDDAVMAERILELYANPERRAQLGEMNLQWIMQHFDPEKMYQEMADLILIALQ